MESKMGRTPPRYLPNPMQVSRDRTFKLRISSGLEGLKLTKWLLTKFYRSGKQFTEEEYCIAHLLSEYWNSYRNKGFFRKHDLEFLKLRALMRLALKPGKLEPCEVHSEKLILSQSVLFSPRAFLSLPPSFASSFLKSDNRLLRKPSPEPRRIGVGYRDKGTAQIPSSDGSPCWREVAVSQKMRSKDYFSSPEWWEVGSFLIPASPKSGCE